MNSRREERQKDSGHLGADFHPQTGVGQQPALFQPKSQHQQRHERWNPKTKELFPMIGRGEESIRCEHHHQ